MSDPLNFCECGCQECRGCTGDYMTDPLVEIEADWAAKVERLEARVETQADFIAVWSPLIDSLEAKIYELGVALRGVAIRLEDGELCWCIAPLELVDGKRVHYRPCRAVRAALAGKETP